MGLKKRNSRSIRPFTTQNVYCRFNLTVDSPSKGNDPLPPQRRVLQRDSLTRFSMAANDIEGKGMGPWYSAGGLFF